MIESTNYYYSAILTNAKKGYDGSCIHVYRCGSNYARVGLAEYFTEHKAGECIAITDHSSHANFANRIGNWQFYSSYDDHEVEYTQWNTYQLDEQDYDKSILEAKPYTPFVRMGDVIVDGFTRQSAITTMVYVKNHAHICRFFITNRPTEMDNREEGRSIHISGDVIFTGLPQLVRIDFAHETICSTASVSDCIKAHITTIIKNYEAENHPRPYDLTLDLEGCNA